MHAARVNRNGAGGGIARARVITREMEMQGDPPPGEADVSDRLTLPDSSEETGERSVVQRAGARTQKLLGDPAPAATPLRRQTFGRYQLKRKLGAGGMGVVYLAFDPLTEREVALKAIRELVPEADIQRFLREIRAAGTLEHPGILTVYDAGVHQGRLFYTMAYVDGESLEDLCQRKKRLPPRRACEIVKQVAEALQYAHEHGILHRDIKPGNILLDAGGHPSIADFGLAKRLDRHTARLTQSGEILGTPAYMSPEQARGENQTLDVRSDVYSLGCVLYRLLTGREPFASDTVLRLLKKIIDEDPIPPRRLRPEIPRDLSAVCLMAIEKLPRHRYASAADLVADLGRFLDGTTVRAHHIGPVRRFGRYLARNRMRVAMMAALVLVFAGLLGYAAAAFRHREKLSTLREQEGGPPSAGREYSLRFLLKAVGDANAETRVHALTALTRQPSAHALGTILDATSDESPEVRLRLADLTPSLPEASRRTVLNRLSRDTHPLVRAKAFQRIASLRLNGFGPTIGDGLRHPSPFVRGAAQQAMLATVEHAEIETCLAGLLGDSAIQAEIKRELLEGMASGRLPPLLQESLPLLQSEARAQALAMLQRATGQSLGADERAWRDWLVTRHDRIRTACLGLVVDAPKGPLENRDVLVAVNGRACDFRILASLPAGTVRVVRHGRVREIILAEPPEGIKVFPSYAVFLDGVPVSGGNVEELLRRWPTPQHYLPE